jgi:Protein of unknown function (DUF4242)
VAHFLVRRTLAGIPAAELRAAVRRVADTTAQMAREGHELRLLHSTYLADGFCACVFDAPSLHVVRLASERAAVPYDDISPATHLSGDISGPAGRATPPSDT